jgi:hypothetical protein
MTVLVGCYLACFRAVGQVILTLGAPVSEILLSGHCVAVPVDAGPRVAGAGDS